MKSVSAGNQAAESVWWESAQALKKGSLSFSIAFNRQQLADYLCVNRAAMSMELSRLQKEGVLKFDKNRFELKEVVEG